MGNTRTVAKLREIFCALDLQHDDTQYVVLWVEMVSASAGLPRLSKPAFLIFGVSGGDRPLCAA